MNAKLELYRRYYCVERDINYFSVLTEWATAYLIQQEYEDNIYELALAKTRKEALFLSEGTVKNNLIRGLRFVFYRMKSFSIYPKPFTIKKHPKR